MSAAEGTKNLSPRRAKTLAQMNAVTDEEVVAFIGRNADRFLPTWEKMREQARGERTFIWSWCWPAFLLGFAWFMYRKMYTMAAVFLFLPILLVLFTPLGDSVGAGYNGALGALGKQMYLGHARTKVQKIKERAASPEEAAEKIARAGGVSIAGGVIGGFIWVGCLILALAPLL